MCIINKWTFREDIFSLTLFPRILVAFVFEFPNLLLHRSPLLFDAFPRRFSPSRPSARSSPRLSRTSGKFLFPEVSWTSAALPARFSSLFCRRGPRHAFLFPFSPRICPLRSAVKLSTPPLKTSFLSPRRLSSERLSLSRFLSVAEHLRCALAQPTSASFSHLSLLIDSQPALSPRRSALPCPSPDLQPHCASFASLSHHPLPFSPGKLSLLAAHRC